MVDDTPVTPAAPVTGPLPDVDLDPDLPFIDDEPDPPDDLEPGGEFTPGEQDDSEAHLPGEVPAQETPYLDDDEAAQIAEQEESEEMAKILRSTRDQENPQIEDTSVEPVPDPNAPPPPPPTSHEDVPDDVPDLNETHDPPLQPTAGPPRDADGSEIDTSVPGAKPADDDDTATAPAKKTTSKRAKGKDDD
jgi:hypothetical protein